MGSRHSSSPSPTQKWQADVDAWNKEASDSMLALNAALSKAEDGLDPYTGAATGRAIDKGSGNMPLEDGLTRSDVFLMGATSASMFKPGVTTPAFVAQFTSPTAPMTRAITATPTGAWFPMCNAAGVNCTASTNTARPHWYDIRERQTINKSAPPMQPVDLGGTGAGAFDAQPGFSCRPGRQVFSSTLPAGSVPSSEVTIEPDTPLGSFPTAKLGHCATMVAAKAPTARSFAATGQPDGTVLCEGFDAPILPDRTRCDSSTYWSLSGNLSSDRPGNPARLQNAWPVPRAMAPEPAVIVGTEDACATLCGARGRPGALFDAEESSCRCATVGPSRFRAVPAPTKTSMRGSLPAGVTRAVAGSLLYPPDGEVMTGFPAAASATAKTSSSGMAVPTLNQLGPSDCVAFARATGATVANWSTGACSVGSGTSGTPTRVPVPSGSAVIGMQLSKSPAVPLIAGIRSHEVCTGGDPTNVLWDGPITAGGPAACAVQARKLGGAAASFDLAKRRCVVVRNAGTKQAGCAPATGVTMLINPGAPVPSQDVAAPVNVRAIDPLLGVVSAP